MDSIHDIPNDSDEHLLKRKTKKRHGGSKKGKRANFNRDFNGRFKRFKELYFGSEGRGPIYSQTQFRRRYRMSRELYRRIENEQII